MEFAVDDFLFLGWNNTEGHDKIWGLVKTSQGLFSFWGKRGKSVAFKQHENAWDAGRIADKKERSGYRKCSTEVLPADFDGQLMMACLGRVKFPIDNKSN
jgi:hypothetical protein